MARSDRRTSVPEEPSACTAVDFFDADAADYEVAHYGTSRSFMTVRQERVLEMVESLTLPPRSRVLDAGCGPGYLSAELAARGHDVVALDAAAAMLDRTRARVAHLGREASLARADIERLPYADEVFDVVCSNGVIEYLDSDHTVLSEFRRVLRPGGHLILPVTNARSPVLWLDAFVEALKRQPFLMRIVNSLRFRGRTIRPRHFRVRRHSRPELLQSLAVAGFDPVQELYFYFLPWPRPFDKVLPRPSVWIGSRMEKLSRTRIAWIAEGFLTLSAKSTDGRAV